MNGDIRVLIVDDQRLMREGLRTLLELEDDLAVVGEAESGEAGVRAFAETQPDVVLMDLTLRGGMNGTETAAEILHLDPDARIVCTSDPRRATGESLMRRPSAPAAPCRRPRRRCTTA